MAVAETEILVAGGGVAALTAGLFGARHGRKTTVLTGGLGAGGSLLSVGHIEDFPGFPDGVPGYDLCPMIQEQASAAGADFQMTSIESLAEDAGYWVAKTSEGEIMAKAVILATGSRFRCLEVPGEERLKRKGVSQCATCDGPLARGATVAVVGGGDSALLETLELMDYVARVVLIHRGDSLDGQQTYRDRILASSGVDVRLRSVVEEILGGDRVTGVRVRSVDGVEDHDVTAVFVYVGTEPNTSLFAPPLSLDAHGRIPTDTSMRTNLPGVYAAGDIRTDSARQGVAAAGDGATAAVSAHRYLSDGVWAAADASCDRSSPTA